MKPSSQQDSSHFLTAVNLIAVSSFITYLFFI